jgi:predicted RNA binding protein YcfA (HicA-like mRNA interferase family)
VSRFGSLKPRVVLRAPERDGWYIHETTGSHVQLKHPKKAGRVTVPAHQGFDPPKPIVRSIIRQADLTNDQFEALLD